MDWHSFLRILLWALWWKLLSGNLIANLTQGQDPLLTPQLPAFLRSLSRARPESELNNVSMELSIVDVSGRCFRRTAVSRAGFKILINAPCPEVYRRMLTFSVGQHLTLFTSPRSRRKWRTQLPLQKLLSSKLVRISFLFDAWRESSASILMEKCSGWAPNTHFLNHVLYLEYCFLLFSFLWGGILTKIW